MSWDDRSWLPCALKSSHHRVCAIYCHVSNYPKTKHLKTTGTYELTVSGGQESRRGLGGGSGSGCFMRWRSSCRQGPQFLKIWGFLFRLSRVAVAGGLSLLPCGPLRRVRATWLPQTKRREDRRASWDPRRRLQSGFQSDTPRPLPCSVHYTRVTKSSPPSREEELSSTS